MGTGNNRVFPPASYHDLQTVSKSVFMHSFLVEIFTLIIFRLWSISLIMTGGGEIAKSLKMHYLSLETIDQSDIVRIELPFSE
jgi:hypothetical protein